MAGRNLPDFPAGAESGVTVTGSLRLDRLLDDVLVMGRFKYQTMGMDYIISPYTVYTLRFHQTWLEAMDLLEISDFPSNRNLHS